MFGGVDPTSGGQRLATSAAVALRVQNPVQSSILDLDWYKTPEGQGVLTHLIDPESGNRKLYGKTLSLCDCKDGPFQRFFLFLPGFLEQPNVPPTIKLVTYKVYLTGRSGSGKTSLVSYLSGRPDWTTHQGETPGVRSTKVFWPARVQQQLVLFELDLWDSGDSSSKKYGHIQPVRICFRYNYSWFGILPIAGLPRRRRRRPSRLFFHRQGQF